MKKRLGVLKSEIHIRKGVVIVFRMPCLLWRKTSLNSRPSIYIRTFSWCFMTTCVSKSFPFSMSKCKFPTLEIFKNTIHPPNTLGKFLGMIILQLGNMNDTNCSLPFFEKKGCFPMITKRKKKRPQNHPLKPLYLY